MKVHRFCAVVAACGLFGGSFGADTDSTYSALSADLSVSGAAMPILATTIVLPAATWVYVQSDGRYYSGGGNVANAYIEVDGVVISNDSLIDWNGAAKPMQHSFNVIGAKFLPAGSHTFTLRGSVTGAAASFGAGTNLSVMTNAASAITNTALTSDTAQLSFNTSGTPEGTTLPAAGMATLISSSAGNSSGPVVAMASGRSFVFGDYGDAMYGIYLNGAEPNIDSMTWSINDLFTGAELHAPMFSQAMFMSPPAQSTVQFVASESPYYQPVNATTNNVKYKVGNNSRLVTLAGGMTVYGKGLTPGYSYSTQGQNRRYAYVCVGTNGYSSSCPASGGEVVLGDGLVCVPSGHNGVVLFSAKTRVQGDPADSGGTVLLKIKIDGNVVGQIGVQGLASAPDSASTRTISASYMAAGNTSLSTGCHTAQVVGQVFGSFRNLSMNADMPLIWFD